MQVPTGGGDAVWVNDGTGSGDLLGKIASTGDEMCIEWYENSTSVEDFDLCRTAADTLTLTGGDLNLTGDLLDSGSSATIPIVFSNFIEENTRNLDENLWGSLLSLSTGDTIDNGPTNIVVTNGISKLVLVLNTCSDSAGDITATGTSVNRDTGAETGSDTSVMTISGTTTDGSDTDASGNTRHSFTNSYITGKWFKGSVTFSTSDVNCTDVDTYSVAFEQVNDSPGLTFQTYDVNAYATNNAAWFYSYCYILDVTGDTAAITREASLELPAADVTANKYYRLRKGSLGVSLDGNL